MKKELIEWAFVLGLGFSLTIIKSPPLLMLVVPLIIIWKLERRFKISEFLKWWIKGKPYITYSGYHCGCCGHWKDESFSIPTYKSGGKWADTWGLCNKCRES